MLFGTDEADRALTVVDWQTVSWGPALTDLAYFLGWRAAGPKIVLRNTTHCCGHTTKRWGQMRRSLSPMSAEGAAGKAFSA